jgi:hypothetical protein
MESYYLCIKISINEKDILCYNSGGCNDISRWMRGSGRTGSTTQGSTANSAIGFILQSMKRNTPLLKSFLYQVIQTQRRYPKNQGNDSVFKGIKA